MEDSAPTDNTVMSVTSDGEVLETEPQSLVDEIQERLEGIELGFEALDSLSRISSAFKKGMKPSKSAMKIGLLAVESVKKSTGIFSHPDVIATECFNGDQVSMEGISSMMRSVWDAIVRTFKAIWDAVHRLIKSIRNKDRKSAIDEIIENVDKKEDPKTAPPASHEETVHNVPENSVPEKQPAAKPEKEEIDLSNFRYLGSRIDTDVLIKELQKMISSAQSAHQLVKIIENSTLGFEAGVNDFERKGITEETIYTVQYAVRSFLEIPEKLFTPAKDFDEFKALLKEKLNVDYYNVDRDSLRELDGLTRGDRIFFFGLKNTEFKEIENSDNWFKTLVVDGSTRTWKNKDTSFDSLVFPGQIKQYANALLLANDEVRKLNEFYERCAAFNERNQVTLMKRMGLFLQTIDPNAEHGEVNSRDRIMVYKAIVYNLNKMMSSLNQCIISLERSREDHFTLLKKLHEKHVKTDTDSV